MSPSASCRVTVCVVAYESGAFLQPCLDALARSDFAGFECVVADNGASDGSGDGSIAALQLPDGRFSLRDMGGNLGFAAANNRIAEASAAEFLACLNPDAQPDPGWLGALVEAADAHPQAASFGSVQLRLDEPHVLDGLGDCWHLAGVAWRAREGLPATDLPGSGPILAPCGAAALHRRAVFLEHGGFEERFFCYAEDVDLGLRLQRAGWSAWRASGSVVRHAGSGVSGRRSGFTLYHGHRNRVWCWVKNTPGPAFWALLPLHLLLDAYLLYAAWRHGEAGAVLRAYRDALLGIGPFWRDRARATGWERLRPVSTLSLRALGRRELVPDTPPGAASLTFTSVRHHMAVMEDAAVRDGGDTVAGASVREPPLVVDLDGTLIRSDLLVESFLALLGADPLAAVRALGALRDGKAAFKAALADAAVVDVTTLPFDDEVLDLVRRVRAEGRETHLASASDHRYVAAVAAHLGLFDGAEGSSGGRNLSGRDKAQALVERFGERGFDYVGDAAVDAAVWARARTAYVVAPSARLSRRLARQDLAPEPVGARRGSARAYLKAMRPHQWMKNLLVFAPLLAGHAFSAATVLSAAAAFVSFSLVASSVYLLNDLLDLRSDREHARKRLRPFASGRASPLRGALLAPALLAAGALSALALPWRFGAALAAYYALTVAYSFSLKRVMTVDVIALACLYGARLVAGGYATGVLLSPWLEALAVFLFLSLALVKRAGELADGIAAGRGDPHGRGYRLGDLPVVEAMAAASGYLAVLVLALYFNSPAVGALYAKPHRLWLICVVVLYWVSRMLMKAHRAEMHDDPLVFAMHDRASLVCGAVAGAALVSANL